MDVPDRPTRGRTREGRLALLDAFLARTLPAPLRQPAIGGREGVVVDLGFGERPDTSRALQRTLVAAGIPLRLVAVERERHRVEAARALGLAGLEFREGGFALPLLPGEEVRLVRVMNVLRGYPEDEAARALGALAGTLPEGALILEGSCDPEGHLLTCHLLRVREGGLLREALLLATDFARGFAPFQLRDWLPRDLRRRIRPGHPVHALLTAWTRHFEAVRLEGLRTPAASFAASAERLAREVEGLGIVEATGGAGQVLWQPPGGVPT